MAQPRSSSGINGLNDSGLVSTSAAQLLHSEIVQLIVSTRTGSRKESGSTASEGGGENDAMVVSSRASLKFLDDQNAGQRGEIESYHALEGLGHGVGIRLIERMLFNKPLRILASHQAMALIAGEMWPIAFEKRPESLKCRNKEGSFTLRDEEFRWLRGTNFKPSAVRATQMEYLPQHGFNIDPAAEGATTTSEKGGAGKPRELGPNDYVFYACGILRGAMEALGFPRSTVHASVEGHCCVNFTVHPEPLEGGP
jgi:hypothetical protein